MCQIGKNPDPPNQGHNRFLRVPTVHCGFGTCTETSRCGIESNIIDWLRLVGDFHAMRRSAAPCVWHKKCIWKSVVGDFTHLIFHYFPQYFGWLVDWAIFFRGVKNSKQMNIWHQLDILSDILAIQNQRPRNYISFTASGAGWVVVRYPMCVHTA